VGKIAGRSRRAASRPCPLVRPCARPAHRQPHRQAELPQHGSQGAIGRMCYSTAGRHDQARPEHPQLSAIRALCQRSERAVSGRCESTKSCCLRAAPILDRRRHSSAVEQLFRKSPPVCAVLPCLESRYKRAHLSAIRSRGARPGSALRAASAKSDPGHPKSSHDCVDSSARPRQGRSWRSIAAETWGAACVAYRVSGSSSKQGLWIAEDSGSLRRSWRRAMQRIDNQRVGRFIDPVLRSSLLE
jgi:hypothetical protein